MMTVRFPNGQAVTYNDACWLTTDESGNSRLYTEKDGKWLATIQVSAGVIIECVRPCGVVNPIAPMISMDKTLERVHRKLRTLSTWELKKLKRALATAGVDLPMRKLLLASGAITRRAAAQRVAGIVVNAALHARP